ncbi:hypothetical protein [Acinetobacter sp. 10FS3-1]|uniref:hypothetical protein n=1 Tax=Acinetobacter sp. 10FS3-1 TaxID=2563897 RepID=UPI00157CC071|nr:hypothetical protein [Acinetobacter sp. 10FS3-1]QKQ71495.1 hypothetical protein E5Y90_14785 [Acinetobacter sp. 10FS3-1]
MVFAVATPSVFAEIHPKDKTRTTVGHVLSDFAKYCKFDEFYSYNSCRYNPNDKDPLVLKSAFDYDRRFQKKFEEVIEQNNLYLESNEILATTY